MKKITTLTCLLFAGLLTHAQYAKQPFALKENGSTRSRMVAGNTNDVRIAASSIKNLAKTTGAVITTDNLGTGTNTTLPTGWTAGGTPAATWKWRNAACTGVYNIGTINSTTAANGWLVYDSDSIGALNGGNTALDAWVSKKWTIPTGHPQIGISFQEWFRSYYDVCYVEVSTDSVNWTQYPVGINNSLAYTSSLATNPYTVAINFASLPLGQTSFYTRFHYTFSGPAGGGYNWLVDDISIVDVDSVDVALRSSFLFGGWGQYGSSAFNALPLAFADSLQPVTLVSNNGFTGFTATTVTANIFKGTTNVYSKTLTRPLVVSSQDSLFDFPAYKPTTLGNYVVTFSTTSTGDATPLNNLDTVRFTISDTIYSQNSGNFTTNAYVHRPASGTAPERSASAGTRFDVPADAFGTMTGISAAFDPSTTVGTKVGVQVYEAGSAGWDAKSISLVKTLTAADISTANSVVYTYFAIDPTLINAYDLSGNSYAAVIVGDNVPATATVALLASSAPNATSFSGYFGQSDTSTNSLGALSFGVNSFATGVTTVPAVRLHFSQLPIFPAGVKEVNSGNAVVKAYPNPAANVLNIAYSLETAATINVKLMNTIGQVIASKSAANTTKGELNFNVASLPAGVYLYTAEVNGKQTTQRVVIAH